MNEPKWMNDPVLAGIDKEKLAFLQTMVFESQSLSPKERLAFLMNLSKKNRHAASFSKEEMDLIISVLKKNSTPEEMARIDKIMKLRAQKKENS